MGVDYYGILKVSKTATEEELRKSYKQLAMRWHPDKHPTVSKPVAEAKFKQICEAYDVLSDSQKRQIYDVYGEEALKTGNFSNVSSPSSAPRSAAAAAGAGAGAGGGGNNNASNNNGAKGRAYRYNPREPDDIFTEFFGSGEWDSNNNNKKPDAGRNGAAAGGPGTERKPGKKAAPMETQLACTLEELYTGSKRKMKISRTINDGYGKPMNVEEVLSIDIKPGWKKGTKITFPEKGNQDTGSVPGDLIFVIDEKPHAVFKRDGNDLILHKRISLLDALTGRTLKLAALDGRTIAIEVSDVVRPGHEMVIENEGMPISKEPYKRGNLKIKFDVKFPKRLSDDQKSDLRRVLGSRSS